MPSPSSLAVVGRCRNPMAFLTAKERQVIMSLRLMMPGIEPPVKMPRHIFGDRNCPIRQIFGEIAAQAAAHGLDIFSPASLFVSEDEMAFISRLSQLQRPSQSAFWTINGPFMAQLQKCAPLLEARLGRLAPRTALAEALHGRAECFDVADQSEANIADGQRRLSAQGCRRLLLRSRALEAARREPVVRTAQFGALGISRQLLGALCKSGYLERVSHGHYRLATRIMKDAVV